MNKQVLACLLVLALATAVVAKRPAFVQISKANKIKHVREIPVTHSTDILSKFHHALTLAQTAQDGGEVDGNDFLEHWIDGLRQSVIAEGQQHAEIHAEQVQDCAREIPFRQNEIADGQVALSNSNAHKAAAIADQNTANAILQVNQAAQQKYNDDLNGLRDQRAREKALFDSRVAAHVDAEGQLNEALAIIDNFEGAVRAGQNYAGFVQLAKKVNTIMMVAIKTGHVHMITPITTMFLEAQQNQFNPEVIDRLRGLFEQLLSNLQASLAALQADEDGAIAVFTAREADLEALIAKLEDEQAALESDLYELAASIDEEGNIEIAAQNKIDRNTNILARAQTLCASYEDQWNSAQAGRANQLKVINALDQAVAQIRQMYPNKFKSLGNALNTAVDVGSTQAEAADETNPFQAYVDAGAQFQAAL